MLSASLNKAFPSWFTHISGVHFLHVVDAVDGQGALVDERVQTGVRTSQDVVWKQTNINPLGAVVIVI